MNRIKRGLPTTGTFCKSMLIFLFLLCGIFQVHAQRAEEHGEGKVSGRIIDSVSGQPVEYASVSLAREADKKEINGTTTDDKGLFELNNIPEGAYRLVVYFVGYQTGIRANIVISKENPFVFIKDFSLSNKRSTLKEVTVSAEKSLIENKIDKMVYNAENDLTSQGGVATDILKKIPQVSVDVDGNVELQGNSNIRFLINGKPSTIFGNSLADVLASIPASQISSIEVITSPGAKYDAEGTGGIINILLRKSTAQGFNGNVSLSAGTRLENGSLNLNARKGHFGARAFFSGNAQLNSKTINSQNRLSQDPTAMQSTSLIQDGTGQFTRNGFQTGGGFDWDINSRNTITGSITYNYFGINNSGLLNRQTSVMDASGNVLSHVTDKVMNENDGNGRTFDWDLNYKKTFKTEGQELEASVNSSTSNSLFHYQQSQAHLPGDTVFNASYGNNPGTEKQTEFTLNYVQPLKEDMELETGLKTVLHHITSNSDVFLMNTTTGSYDYSNSQSMAFVYDRNVYAGYASLSFKLFHFLDVKAGGRYEYTADKANFSNAGEVIYAPYSTVVPSLALSHKLKKDQVIKLSYSHRIERPDYHDLNPFLNAADPRNISTGNVNLRPEQANKIELGYSKSFEKGSSLNITLFARLNTDDIQSYTKFYPSFKVGDSTYSNVSVTYRENIGHENNLGGNIFVNIPITEKITLRSNISCFERYIITGLPGGGDVHGFNYRINMNASYQVTPSLALEAFGNFNSPRINAQGTNPSFTTYTFAFRKQFFHKKGSVAVTATNPFSEYIDQRTVLAGQNFTTNSDRQLPYRSFGINLTWKFGKMEFKKQHDNEENTIPEPPTGN
jgi:ferric enterobactin receptor